MTSFLYCLVSPVGKKYYGVTGNFKRRMKEHEHSACANSSLLLHKAIRKYGWDSFSKELVCEGSREVMLHLEVSAIATANTFMPVGYNMTYGGDGGAIPAAMGGKKASALCLGVHNPVVRSAAGKRAKALGRGVHAATSEQLSEWSKRSKIKWTSEQATALASRKFSCDICGLIANAGNMKQHQTAKNHHGIAAVTGNLP